MITCHCQLSREEQTKHECTIDFQCINIVWIMSKRKCCENFVTYVVNYKGTVGT